MTHSQTLLHAYMRLQTRYLRERKQHIVNWPLGAVPAAMEERPLAQIRELGAEVEAARLAWLLALKAESSRDRFTEALAG